MGLLSGPVAAAAELHLQKLQRPDPVPTGKVKKQNTAKIDRTARHPWKKPKVTWPKPGTVTPELPKTGAPVKAGSLPVHVGRAAGKPSRTAKTQGPQRVQVQVLDRATTESLGVEGVVLALRPTAGAKSAVDVKIDYSGFRNAYGGDWASRLTLRTLPACALTSPGKKGCATGEALPTRNDVSTGSLTAAVPLPAAATTSETSTNADPVALTGTTRAVSDNTVLLAATAQEAGPSGTFAATPLSPSASWAAGGSNGAFSWNYPLDTPDVAGSATPDLKLGYSSQSVDGRTASTNNQANSIGDGWSMEPGYIERQYISCSEDTKDSNTTAKVGDLCWKKDNAVINLGGQSNTLVKNTTNGEWHLESDDGTKIVKLTDSALANGDDNNEYWQVTTPDGTRYYFGHNHPEGWTTGKDETNSTWTVPVFGNQKDEPCHATEFKDSWCQQAWRWNLDAVIDPHGDAMTYYWDKETNYYGLNVNTSTGASTATPYISGGSLKRIEYGLRSSNFYAQPAAKVDFTTDERCLSNCGTFDKDHAKNWPDVPFDRYCASGTECKDRYSPSFWSRKRLKKIDTSVLVGTTYKPVDTWALTHQFPPTGDGSDPALWLASITRTGHGGTGDVTLPAVTFKGESLPNRVEGATIGGKPDPVPPLWRYRVYGIDTETGGTIGVTYSPTDCKAGDVPTPTSNTRRCYPVKWSPPDAPAADYEPYLDWFHSYVVTQILETDNTGGAPAKQTDYAYLDGMGWAQSKDDEFTDAKHLTYGDRKGYGRVQVRTGAAPDQRTLKEYRYFRGIDGASVQDHEGIAVTDREAFAGMTREEATYNGDGGKLETTTSYEPWRSAATATETRTEGLPTRYAYATAGKSEQTRTAVGSGWRTNRTERTFDEFGQPLTESSLGDTAKSGDEECTTTTYARNATLNILNLVSEAKTVAKPCGTAPSLPADLISAERHFYDEATSLSTTPVKGDVTRLDEQDAKGTGYLTTATHTYDQHGREKTSTDALQNTTTTAYAPTTVQAPTTVTVTNARNHGAVTTHDPVRGVVTATVDANGKRTDAVYDGLGRVRKVWQPGWPEAGHENKPSVEYDYTISRTDANAVTTKTLKQNGDYSTTYALYDGLLRERQTQAAATGTQNRIMTETHYDTRGWAWQTYAAYYADGAPSATLESAAVNTLPATTQNLYDGMGRVTDTLSLTFGDEKWRTKTVYAGDRTTVIPPEGGTATTTVTDARGRTTDLLQYTNTARTTSQKTTYTYGKYDEPATVTDPDGNTWTYTFDYRGQKIETDDPDQGTIKTAYDDLGRPVTETDDRGVTLTTGYDEIGRKTDTKQGDTVLAKWTYDTLAKGQLTSSTRYVAGAAYTTATAAFNDRYQPTSTTSTIPSAAGGLAGTYTWTYGYNEETGALLWTLNPTLGNIPAERVTTNYNSDDQPYRTSGERGALVSNTLYDVFSRPERLEFGATLGQKAYRSQVYDDHTGRMIQQTTDRDTAPQRVDDTSYSYDPAGNITGVKTVSGQDTQKSTDTQCFTNDPLGHLTEAWTAKTDCTTAPSATTVGGPDAYWQSFSYDALGNRTGQTEHATTTGTDATTTYTHPAPGTGLPHGVQQAKVSGGPDNGRTSTFEYDETGNTTKRTLGTTTQDLTWDAEGHLATLTEAGKTSSYVYDADGNRLIAKNADGTSVLTLPNGDELTLAANGTKTGTRYYTHNGETVAVRTGGTISYLISDYQGTAMTAITVGTLAITRRKQLPFGQLRTTQSTAFGTRGYVGGTNDPTGLTHLGAREYDPTLGRFLSVDPIIDITDPAQMNAYSYAHNNPLTKSDPDGLRPDGPAGGASYNDDAWARDRGMNAGYTQKGSKWVWRQTPKKDPESQFLYAAYRQNTSGYLINDYYAKQRSIKAAQYRAQAAERAKKRMDAERRKKDGIWGNIKKGEFGAAWDNSLGNADWLKHKGVDMGITTIAALGTAFCIASVVCGAGVFLVGAGALFVAGLGAHMAMATPEERADGAGKFVKRTAVSEAKGVLAGALCGRGPGGCLARGPKAGTPLAGIPRRKLAQEALRISGRTIREYAFR
ncbi:RHS repeat domain-containing protein [Streptomyces atratus]|uniref:RHS repeat domain-containing protein n=1 Tax=Streptomyces atratus TaxID=1893 RepID=UPI0022544F66|nr:RHS repeat-associated core domain-containing protein [Streptomyces atratus]MCX5345765.1 RHS repeat protein [Streptomyces atratus]MCX5345921.1 RHS repeat protein [Streptomyces atratus]MCX5346065.1 RHS repeat protein [Streptomyces atratus]